MELRKAIEHILETRSYRGSPISKYRIAKIADVQSSMVDRWLSGETRTLRREAANKLMETLDVEIDDHCINGYQKDMFVNRHNQLDY